MKALKFWVMFALILSYSVIGLAPSEAWAGKGLGITKTQYIKSLNSWLSPLRFEKTTTKFKDGDIYTLDSDSSGALLGLGGTGQLEKVTLVWIKSTDSNEFNLVTKLCVIFAVEPNPDTTTSKTADLFHKKFQDKMNQGLNKFSFEMGNKHIDVKIEKGANGSSVTIEITRP